MAAETPNFDDVKQKQMYRENIPSNPPMPKTPEYENLMAFTSQVDVILHTVNDNEFQAAITCMGPPDHFTKAVQNFPCSAMVVGTFAGKKVALIQTPPGNNCRKSIEKAVESFPNAMYIIAVGVCYAFDRMKYKLGDVLVSKRISDFSEYKHKRDDTVEDRGETINVEGFLSDTFCLNAIHNPQFNVTETRESDVYSGRFLSHPVLMDNKTERDKFHAAAPNAIGGEMEGGVLMQVSKEDNSIAGIIVIKGVVDYADGDKEKQWQFTAALAAVHYAQSKLRAVNLPPRGKAQEPAGHGGFEETAGRLPDDQFGKIKKIVGRYAPKWRTIGQGLGFTHAELDAIQGKPALFNQAPDSYLDEMLANWYEWRPSDERGSKGFATQADIATAVDKAGLGVTAQEIRDC